VIRRLESTLLPIAQNFARVVDTAPTLAVIVRVTPQEKPDGHILQNAIR
jgi:hypothetical protein